MSSSSDCEPVFYRYTPPSHVISPGIRLSRGSGDASTARRIVLPIAESNSTPVPNSLVPSVIGGTNPALSNQTLLPVLSSCLGLFLSKSNDLAATWLHLLPSPNALTLFPQTP